MLFPDDSYNKEEKRMKVVRKGNVRCKHNVDIEVYTECFDSKGNVNTCLCLSCRKCGRVVEIAAVEMITWKIILRALKR